MARLAGAFSGEWTSVEVVQFGRPVPADSGRRGTVRTRLAEGGTALVSEGRAVGTVGGDLRWFGTLWWDPRIARYRLLICFTAGQDAGCELRGTARWIGLNFVNDYQETVDGKITKMQDVWSEIRPGSYTLTELHR